MPSRAPAAVNSPLPPPLAGDGTRLPAVRRYHYLTVAVPADPEAVADECNRLAGQGYTLVAQVPGRETRQEVLLTFARRLRRRRGHPVAAVEVTPAAEPTAEPTAEVEVVPGLTVREV